jgi:methyl-accepting chemotaxis protein
LAITAVCDRIADGDLEVRVPQVSVAALAPLREGINHLVDVTDAFVREAGAVLAAASNKKFHRRFLLRGMRKAFHDGAKRIDTARANMEAAERALAAEKQRRGELAEKILDIAAQVAAASTEFGASAASLATSAGNAVNEIAAAVSTMRTLEASSREIGSAAELIRRVAAQTKLLALNATIEAARAGAAGAGFAVVAQEIKSLADEAAHSSDGIGRNIQEAQNTTVSAVGAISEIERSIEEMYHQVDGIAAAAGGGAGGLSAMAELLRAEIDRFVNVA